jgi:hypothetical protein
VRVGGALARIARHPVHFLATRWHWKAALLSALLRGALFFGSTLSAGLSLAAQALLVDAAFRVPVAGLCAAVVQELRWAEPRRVAEGIVILGIPAASHAIELAVHRAAATPMLWRGIGASMVLSVVSSAVEFVLMRHNVMLVGPGAGSLASDLRRLVRIARTRLA